MTAGSDLRFQPPVPVQHRVFPCDTNQPLAHQPFPPQIIAQSEGDADDELLSVAVLKGGKKVGRVAPSFPCKQMLARARRSPQSAASPAPSPAPSTPLKRVPSLAPHIQPPAGGVRLHQRRARHLELGLLERLLRPLPR